MPTCICLAHEYISTCTLIPELTCFKKCVTSGVGTSSLTKLVERAYIQYV